MNNNIKRQARCHYLTEFPSIFKPIKRGARSKAVEIDYIFKNGNKVQVWMFKQLDIGDQDLFLGIISLISEYEQGTVITNNPQNEVTKILRTKLQLNNNLFELPVLKLEVTIHKLLKTLNKWDGNRNYKWVLESLERLSRCGISYDTDKYTGNSNLISYEVNKDTKTVHIAINPISAAVFLNNDKYVVHNLQNRYQLKLDAAKALQSYLNRFVRFNQSKVFYIDTLINGVYGETTKEERKNRRRIIIKAIEELKVNGEYEFKEGLNNSYLIKRKRG